jgi:glycosyltransferase involved in cell wall biosynthesis
MARFLSLLRSPSAVQYLLSDSMRRNSTRWASTSAHLLALVLYRLGASQAACFLLMRAHRGMPTRTITHSVLRHREAIIRYSRSYVRRVDAAPGWQRRCIVLRMPAGETAAARPGVLLIKFSRTFGAAAAMLNTRELRRQYYVVLEPDWAGYCLPEILAWCGTGRPVIVQSSAASDREFLSEFCEELVPVEFGASDWVDHRIFCPLNCEKRYDSVYVANLSRGKRLHAYLRAIATIVKDEPAYRGALVCSDWGGSQGTLEALIKFYEVGGHVDIYHQVPQFRLNEILNLSKVNVLMSLKEGSNKSLFEAMFAGTPVMALRENTSINQSYVNYRTGRLVPEQEVVEALKHFRYSWQEYDPRAWAMANISPQVTTQKLETLLRQLSPDGQAESGGGLLVKVNSPEATYWDPGQAAGIPSIDKVLAQFETRPPFVG